MKKVFVVKDVEGKKSKFGVNVEGKNISIVHLSGRMLEVNQLTTVLMLWEDFAKLVQEYAVSSRKYPFTIQEKKKHIGRSTDLTLYTVQEYTGFQKLQKYAVMHISYCDKLNYDWFGYIGDFVEFLCYYSEDCRKSFTLDFSKLFGQNVYDMLGFLGLDSVKLSEPKEIIRLPIRN